MAAIEFYFVSSTFSRFVPLSPFQQTQVDEELSDREKMYIYFRIMV